MLPEPCLFNPFPPKLTDRSLALCYPIEEEVRQRHLFRWSALTEPLVVSGPIFSPMLKIEGDRRSPSSDIWSLGPQLNWLRSGLPSYQKSKKSSTPEANEQRKKYIAGNYRRIFWSPAI